MVPQTDDINNVECVCESQADNLGHKGRLPQLHFLTCDD